jgi:hypothetical protein
MRQPDFRHQIGTKTRRNKPMEPKRADTKPAHLSQIRPSLRPRRASPEAEVVRSNRTGRARRQAGSPPRRGPASRRLRPGMRPETPTRSAFHRGVPRSRCGGAPSRACSTAGSSRCRSAASAGRLSRNPRLGRRGLSRTCAAGRAVAGSPRSVRPSPARVHGSSARSLVCRPAQSSTSDAKREDRQAIALADLHPLLGASRISVGREVGRIGPARGVPFVNAIVALPRSQGSCQ